MQLYRCGFVRLTTKAVTPAAVAGRTAVSAVVDTVCRCRHIRCYRVAQKVRPLF